MSKKDYSKLRPFDLEAARDRGEPLTGPSDACDGNPIWKYAAGPDSRGRIAATFLADGYFANPASMNALRMAPLAWARKSADDDTLWPVYKGDVLYAGNKLRTASGLYTDDDGDTFLTFVEDGFNVWVSGPHGGFGTPLTFPLPKVKREGWVNVYQGGNTGGHAYASKEKADNAALNRNRVACIRIEWDEPA